MMMDLVMSRDFTVYIIIMSRHVPLQQKAMPESITALQLSVSQQDLVEQTQSQV